MSVKWKKVLFDMCDFQSKLSFFLKRVILWFIIINSHWNYILLCEYFLKWFKIRIATKITAADLRQDESVLICLPDLDPYQIMVRARGAFMVHLSEGGAKFHAPSTVPQIIILFILFSSPFYLILAHPFDPAVSVNAALKYCKFRIVNRLMY